MIFDKIQICADIDGIRHFVGIGDVDSEEDLKDVDKITHENIKDCISVLKLQAQHFKNKLLHEGM